MARYEVLSSKTEIYEPSYKFPMINILAALVWSIAFMQKVLPTVEGIQSLVIGAVFILIYIILCMTPVVAILPAVASGIVYAVMLWALADKIGNDAIRIIIKILILLIDVFIEFMVIVNATLRWLQYKFPVKPRIRIVSDDR